MEGLMQELEGRVELRPAKRKRHGPSRIQGRYTSRDLKVGFSLKLMPTINLRET